MKFYQSNREWAKAVNNSGKKRLGESGNPAAAENISAKAGETDIRCEHVLQTQRTEAIEIRLIQINGKSRIDHRYQSEHGVPFHHFRITLPVPVVILPIL